MKANSELKYFISSYGCQMNYADAERFAGILQEAGLSEATDINNTDILILNSCSVRQKAEDRVLGLTREIEKIKTKNPNLIVVLTGCMARRTWQGVIKTGSPIQMTQKDREEQLIKTLPWVNYVLESKDFYRLPEILGKPILNKTADYLAYKPKLSSTFKGYVPISVGCDHFCSYCIVPFARGREVCRDANSIINEVKDLISKGFTDITLLGQTVNRWIAPEFDQEYKQGAIANTRIPELNTKPLAGQGIPRDFLQLLQVIDALPGDFWLTFMSSHPNYMTEELIDFLAGSKHFRPYIHFALQSGSDAVLKRMNRRYTVAEFSATAKKMQEAIPWLGLSTDIIVGYPGESEAEFQETATVMKELKFDMAFLSEFSPRKGTAAGLIPDDISHQEKTRRKKYLNDEILAVSALAKNQAMVGHIFKTLVESVKNNVIMARTGNYKEIRIKTDSKTDNKKAPDLKPGQFINVKVTASTPWALQGELI